MTCLYSVDLASSCSRHKLVQLKSLKTVQKLEEIKTKQDGNSQVWLYSSCLTFVICHLVSPLVTDNFITFWVCIKTVITSRYN